MYSTRKTVKHYQVGDMGIMKDGYPDIKLFDCYAVVLELQKIVWNNGVGVEVEVSERAEDEDGYVILLMTPVECCDEPYLVQTSMRTMRKHFMHLTSIKIDPEERKSLLCHPCNMHRLG